MYNQWLQLFFSPITTIPVKGRKEKQEITKSWIDEGKSLRLSGDKPSPWSITLRLASNIDIRAYLYHTIDEKDKAVDKMRTAFKQRDDNLFRIGEKNYQEEEEKERKIKDILDGYRKKRVQTAEKLFQSRRDLYLLNRKRYDSKSEDFHPTKDNKKMLERLNKEIRELTIQQIKQDREIMMDMLHYTPELAGMQQQGPYPSPPDIAILPQGIGRKRIILGAAHNKSENESEPVSDNEDSEQTSADGMEASESSEVSKQSTQEGGDGEIKIIKLY